MTQVLIVEDDAWQAEHLARQLSQAGFAVEVAAHALQAIDAVDASPPDVVLLDVLLPGANGIALLHELRSHADLAKLPVIICSNSMVEQAALRPYGVVAVLDKATMTASDVVAAIKRVTG